MKCIFLAEVLPRLVRRCNRSMGSEDNVVMSHTHCINVVQLTMLNTNMAQLLLGGLPIEFTTTLFNLIFRILEPQDEEEKEKEKQIQLVFNVACTNRPPFRGCVCVCLANSKRKRVFCFSFDNLVVMEHKLDDIISSPGRMRKGERERHTHNVNVIIIIMVMVLEEVFRC